MLIVFPLQQRLHESPSMLRYVYVACLNRIICETYCTISYQVILYNIQRWNRQNMAEQKQKNFTVMSLSLSY